MNIQVTSKNLKTDFEIQFIIKKDTKNPFIKEYKKLIELSNFKYSEGETLLLLEAKKIFVSVNDISDLENFKIAASNAIKTLKKIKIKSAKISSYDKKDLKVAKAIAEGILLGAYQFDKYKSKKTLSTLETVYFQTANYYGEKIKQEDLKQAVEDTKIVCDVVNLTRDMVNSHPDELYPETFAKLASKEAKEYGIECKVLKGNDLEEEKMGSLLSVARASVHTPRVIHLSYKPKNAKKRVVLVGKGLTYDSGGLSLKPADFMTTMKSDKSGGAAVLGAILGASKMGVDVEIHAIIGAVENMIGGNAYKPDDVLVARNGKTIEVKNTDAEGRLVLADCLSYGCDLKPDYIIDVATLTGACVVALGEYSSGIMGFNEKLKEAMAKSAQNSGELTGMLPFNRYLKDLLKSNVADISNIGSSRYGGAITAGLFLSEFVEEKYHSKWLHLDIAGPAYVEKDWGYNPFGGSGAGVRMLIDFIANIK